MYLADVPDGTSIFIDANILAYHRIQVEGITRVVTDFLERIEHLKLRAHSSTSLVAEAIHKVMLARAVEQYGFPNKGIVARLKKKQELVKGLSYHPIVADIGSMGISIETVTPMVLERAEALFAEHGLLTNDSIALAIMEHLGLTHLATNDDDFDSVPWVTVWKPR